MTYNRINYNEALYNLEPDEFGAFAKSVISAHTGPHIQAVVGGSGLSFISDFNVIEGPITRPETAFEFPDLSAYLRVVVAATADLNAFIKAQPFKDLPASIVPVGNDPVLRAYIRAFNAITTLDLAASIVGAYAELDLAAILQGTEYLNLAAKVFSQLAPDLPAFIGAHEPANLGAIIWSPEDLGGIINPTHVANLPAFIRTATAGTANLGAQTFGYLPGDLPGYLNPMQTKDLGARIGPTAAFPDLGASIFPDYPFLGAVISAIGQVEELSAVLNVVQSLQANLGAYILGNHNMNLAATVSALSATSLSATITSFPFGAIIRDLRGFLQPVRVGGDLSAFINPLLGLANLGATISSFTTTKDLGARLVVDETFITSVLTIVTLSASNLGAVIGNPNCDGGSAIKELAAIAQAQAALNLSATIQSFREANLGALINSNRTFRAFDTIDVVYTRYNTRPKKFRFTDTIDVKYVPFRGATLSAFINATSPEANLGARVTATFPLLKYAPFTSRVRAIDLVVDPLDITDISLQLEGQVVEYLYVQGIDYAFVKDPDDQWRINIRAFKELAENVFGDHDVARICRLGALQSFATLDEAVRFCITSVLGLRSQGNMGAFLNASGGYLGLSAVVGVVDHFHDLAAICNRAFPSDVFASIVATGQAENLSGSVIGFSVVNIGATINLTNNFDMVATITGV